MSNSIADWIKCKAPVLKKVIPTGQVYTEI